MHATRHIAALALAATILSPAPAFADDQDDLNAPFSSPQMLLPLCGSGPDGAHIPVDLCKERGYGDLAVQLDNAIRAAAAKAPANVRPLLKRDQAFFYEMISMAAGTLPTSDKVAMRDAFDAMPRDRIAALPQIADGFGRGGVLGKWVDAFGSITVTPGDGGAYRVAVETSSIYGLDDADQWRCQASALVRPDGKGWLAGAILPEPDALAHPDTSSLKYVGGKPSPPPSIKLRRQGDTLRVVVGEPADSAYDLVPHCPNVEQVTGSFFAAGKSESKAAEKIAASFTAPTFDCTRPETASEEEICSDPDLAGNDQRLNRAWKALLPRLDDATRRALADDQRHWLQSQVDEYPLALHPGQLKITYGMHYTSGGREGLGRLQRGRIALLEAFDESRKGLIGTWVSYTAVLEVTAGDDGGIEAKGWKWDQGNWKGGCEYDMSGKVKSGAFRAEDGGKNPDTLERDHAMLIVNRLDDAFAKRRTPENGADEMKCRHSIEASSTARLFPAKPSPDIDALAD
jgi:hypothetical protein